MCFVGFFVRQYGKSWNRLWKTPGKVDTSVGRLSKTPVKITSEVLRITFTWCFCILGSLYFNFTWCFFIFGRSWNFRCQVHRMCCWHWTAQLYILNVLPSVCWHLAVHMSFLLDVFDVGPVRCQFYLLFAYIYQPRYQFDLVLLTLVNVKQYGIQTSQC